MELYEKCLRKLKETKISIHVPGPETADIDIHEANRQLLSDIMGVKLDRNTAKQVLFRGLSDPDHTKVEWGLMQDCNHGSALACVTVTSELEWAKVNRIRALAGADWVHSTDGDTFAAHAPSMTSLGNKATVTLHNGRLLISLKDDCMLGVDAVERAAEMGLGSPVRNHPDGFLVTPPEGCSLSYRAVDAEAAAQHLYVGTGELPVAKLIPSTNIFMVPPPAKKAPVTKTGPTEYTLSERDLAVVFPMMREKSATSQVYYDGYIDEMMWIDAMSKIPTLRDPKVFAGALELQVRKYLDRNGGKDPSVKELNKARWYLTYLIAYLMNNSKPILGSQLGDQLKYVEWVNSENS